jgi:membrane-associated phospholipid phosphatase
LSVAIPVRREGSDAGARTRIRLPARLARRAGRRLRTRWWVELLTIAWLAWVYDAISNLAHLRLHQALANGRGVLDLERSLHIDPELSLDRWLAHHHTLGTVLSAYYDNAHWGFTLALLGWVWWRRADLYRPLRNSLVLVNLLGFIVFWRYPVAPPRMLAGFTDVISTNAVGPDFHGGALASNANEVAAMPSLHMAWAAWCALALWRLSSRRWVRALAVAYPSVTAFTVVATGNHFVLDLVAGLATLALALALLAAPRAARVWWMRSAPGRRRMRWRLEGGRRGLEERAGAAAYGVGHHAAHRAGMRSSRAIHGVLHPEMESVSD